MLNFLKLHVERHLALLAFLISFALSPWMLNSWRVLNSDGIFYLQLAYAVNTQGIGPVFASFDWPFFPIIIAFFHNLTHLSYVSSAYVLEAIFMGFSALFFVKIIESLNSDKLTQWMCLLVFFSFETLINYRTDIFRDPGYWAFYLSSFYFLLQFTQTPNIKNGLLWFFSSFIAALFRIEGIAVLIFTPFVVIFFKNFSLQEKIKAYIKLNLPLFFLLPATLLVITFYWLHDHHILGILRHKLFILFSDHWDYISLWNRFELTATKFNDLILGKYAKQGSAEIILFFGYSAYFLCKITWIVGLLNIILILSTWIKKLINYRPNQKLVIAWLLIITLFIPYNFLIQKQFVSTRYLITAALTLLVFTPFALSYCYTNLNKSFLNLFSRQEKIDNKKINKFSTLRTFFILYLLCAAGDFIFLGSQLFYKRTNAANIQANIWLKENKAQLTNVCSTDAWPIFAIIGEKVSLAQVDSSLAILNNPASNCQFFVFVNSHPRMARLTILSNMPDWQLYKSFKDRNPKRNVYIFKHTPVVPVATE